MEALQSLSNDSFSYSWLLNVKPSSFDGLDDAVRLSFDASDGDPFIEIEPWLVSLRRASVDAVLDFDFGLSASQTPVLAHADQIFSDGLILPLHLVTPTRSLQQAEEEAPRSSDCSSDSALSRSLSVESSSRVLLSLSNRYTLPGRPTSSLNSSSPSLQPLDPSAAKRAFVRRPGGPKSPFLRTCERTSKRILQKYLCFLIPLYKKVKGLKFVWSAESCSVVAPSSVRRSCGVSSDASPRISGADAFPDVDCCPFSRVPDAGVETSIHDAVLHCKRSIYDQNRFVGVASDQ